MSVRVLGRPLCRCLLKAGLPRTSSPLRNVRLIRGSAVYPNSQRLPLTFAPVRLLSKDSSKSSTIDLACWKCKKSRDPLSEQFFCAQCNTVQPATASNHFACVGFPISFSMNTDQLSQKFKDLQMQLHPDRFTQKSKEEREYSAEQSSRVNVAYKILSKPLSRALYIFELHGVPLHEGEIQTDPDFLMEMMELNEKAAETPNLDEVRRMSKENLEKLATMETELKQLSVKKNVEAARDIAVKMKYFATLQENIENRLGV